MDHFNDLKPVSRAAERFPSGVDAVQKVLEGRAVAGDPAARVRTRFRGSDAGAAHRGPGAGTLSGPEGMAPEYLDQGFDVDPEIKDTPGADGLQSKCRLPAAGVFTRIKEQGDAAGHLVPGVDLVPKQGADALVTLAEVCGRGGSAVLVSGGGAC